MEKKKLPPITVWIKESLSIYLKRENLIYLTKFALLQLLLSGIIFLYLFATTGSTGTDPNMPLPETPPSEMIPFFGLLIVVGILNFWIYTAIIGAIGQILNGKILGVKETMMTALKRAWPLFLGSILTGFIIVVGFILLIIPGILFIVWFYFTGYLIVADNLGPIKALKRSRELTKGYFIPLSLRLFVSMIYMMILNILLSFALIPLIGTIILALIGPYFQLLPFLLLRDLKKVKGN